MHERCLPNRERRGRERKRERGGDRRRERERARGGETGGQAAHRKRWLSDRVLKTS